MDPPGGSEREFVQLSGNGRAVSDAVVAATRGTAAIAGESRSADAGGVGASGKHGADQAADWPRGVCDSGRGIADETVSRDIAIGGGAASGAPAGRDGGGRARFGGECSGCGD